MTLERYPVAREAILAPDVITAVPGPRSRQWVTRLAAVECPAITARRARRAEESGVTTDPIVWSRAEGCHVWDVDGNRYVDLSGAFAVAAVGHAHPSVVQAGRQQLGTLIHAMGDVFPSRPKIELGERLARLTPGDLGHAIFAQSGAEAVEAALKTAVMATGRTGILAFSGGYHGLSYGALAATAYKASFRAPFLAQLNPRITHLPFPGNGLPNDDDGAARCLELVEHHLTHPASGSVDIGAVVAEPIQGRGGIVRPPRP